MSQLLLIMVAEIPVAAADSEQEYRKSIEQIGSQIKKISRNLNANKALLKTEQDRLFAAEKKLADIQQKLRQTAEQLTAKQAQIKKLDERLTTAREQQRENRAALKKLIETRYKNGRQEYLKRFLNQENPYAVGRLNSYHSYFSRALQTRFTELEAQIQASTQLHTELQKALSELVLQRETQNQLKAELQTAKQEREQTVNRLNQKVGASEEKLDKLKKDRARLNKLLEQIAKQAAELKRLEEERARKQAQNQPAQVRRLPVKGGFLKQKGRLMYPVSGKIRTRYGNRLPESGMQSEGMFFDTNGPQPVRTVYRGRVLFADFLKGYGRLIIVDHGDDHISLYGHNELLYKQVGDTVETNEIIARSGNTGGLKSTGLYFEIRHNATPVNPSLWCQ